MKPQHTRRHIDLKSDKIGAVKGGRRFEGVSSTQLLGTMSGTWVAIREAWLIGEGILTHSKALTLLSPRDEAVVSRISKYSHWVVGLDRSTALLCTASMSPAAVSREICGPKSDLCVTKSLIVHFSSRNRSLPGTV